MPLLAMSLWDRVSHIHSLRHSVKADPLCYPRTRCWTEREMYRESARPRVSFLPHQHASPASSLFHPGTAPPLSVPVLLSPRWCLHAVVRKSCSLPNIALRLLLIAAVDVFARATALLAWFISCLFLIFYAVSLPNSVGGVAVHVTETSRLGKKKPSRHREWETEGLQENERFVPDRDNSRAEAWIMAPLIRLLKRLPFHPVCRMCVREKTGSYDLTVKRILH